MASLLGSFDPTAMFLSVIIGGIGLGLFVYGKKAQRMPHLVTGLLLMVYPYFTPSTVGTVVVGAVIGLGFWAVVWWGL